MEIDPVFETIYFLVDNFCDLVVTVPGYRSRGPGSIPGPTRFFFLLEVVGLERSPLSLVSTTEELLERKSSGSCLENREYSRRDPSRWLRDIYPQSLALTSPTSGGRSVGIVRSRAKAVEIFYLVTQNSGQWKESTNPMIPSYTGENPLDSTNGTVCQQGDHVGETSHK
jgi:hypothetical protein